MVSDTTTRFRASQLKAMHGVMRCTNDEGLYMRWITVGVPDCPQDDDFEFIAEDLERYNECVDLFIKLVNNKGYRA